MPAAQASAAQGILAVIEVSKRYGGVHLPQQRIAPIIQRMFRFPNVGPCIKAISPEPQLNDPVPPAEAVPSAKPPRPPSRITVKWAGGWRFDGGREGGPTARFDGSGETGQSPPEGLLSALASCTGVDVVEILAKQRTPLQSLEIRVVGERVDTTPRRFKHITLTYHMVGRGIEPDQAERAVQLAVTKYCSVRDSLAADIKVDWKIEIAPAVTTEASDSGSAARGGS